jgi:hypothetical protein
MRIVSVVEILDLNQLGEHAMKKTIFLSYSRDDKVLKDYLVSHPGLFNAVDLNLPPGICGTV